MKKTLLLLLMTVALVMAGCSNSNNTSSKKDTKKVKLLDLKSNVIDDNVRNYYQVFVYSFCDSNGDGIGDINGVTNKLDYIADTGFNGIWLSPIHPSTTYHKYDVTDYMNIDEQYGTLDDFKKFMSECQKRNIKVILDLVLNHTSAKHEWFVQASDYLCGLKKGQKPDASKCPYIKYYNFKKNGADLPGYVELPGSDYYYEARFWDQMPDLNLDNPQVRKELEKVMSFWLDMGVGGFRLDAAKEYSSNNTDKNTKTLEWVNSYCRSVKSDVYLVAEVWDLKSAIMNNYQSGINSLFNFPFAQSNGEIIKTVRNKDDGKMGREFAQKEVDYQQEIAAIGGTDQSSANFLSNHDVGRISGFTAQNEELMKYSAGINLMLSGNSFVYYGEELGMSGSVKGVPGKDENKRAPMYWSADKNAKGMTKGPIQMDDVVHEFAPLEKQKDDSGSIYNYYRNALRIRNAFPEIGRGTESVSDITTDGDIIALDKTYNDITTTVLINNSDKSKKLKLDLTGRSGIKLKTSLGVDQKEASLKDDVLEMPKYAIAVLGGDN